MKSVLTGLTALLLTMAAQAQQASPVCKVPPPKVAGVVWQGQAAYMAKAHVADGRVRMVEIRSLTDRIDRRTQRMLTTAIDTALRRATCEPGNHVFEQRFDFDLPATPPTPAASQAS
jgi:protein TonB